MKSSSCETELNSFLFNTFLSCAFFLSFCKKKRKHLRNIYTERRSQLAHIFSRTFLAFSFFFLSFFLSPFFSLLFPLLLFGFRSFSFPPYFSLSFLSPLSFSLFSLLSLFPLFSLSGDLILSRSLLFISLLCKLVFVWLLHRSVHGCLLDDDDVAALTTQNTFTTTKYIWKELNIHLRGQQFTALLSFRSFSFFLFP